MLKLASLSLAILLSFASPSFASKIQREPVPTKKCLTPKGLTEAAPHTLQYRIEGDVLVHFRDAYDAISSRKSTDNVDLMLVFGDSKHDPAWTIIGFKNGCQIGARLVRPHTIERLLDGGGSI